MTDSVYVFVRDGVVDNLVVADEAFVAMVAGEGLYDVALRVDGLDPHPGVGWTYDAENGFAPPPPPPPPPPVPPVRAVFSPAGMTDLGGDSPALNSAPTGAPSAS